MNPTTKPLGELCNVRIGRTPRRDSPQYWGGSAVWVTIRELEGGIITDSKEHISDLAVRETMPPPVMPGTLLFSFKLSIGKMGVAGVPLHTNEAIAALEIKMPDQLARDYLRFALTACKAESGANHAVLGKVLNKEKVENLRIPIVPIKEQHRIVDILSRAEGIVRLRRAAQKKAAELIPALFLGMFGDPATNPKGWPVLVVKDFVARFVGGKNVQAGEDGASEFRILKVSAVTSGTYIETESKPAPLGYAPPRSYMVHEGDLLFSRANTEQLVGATALVESSNGKTLLPDKLWRFVWKDEMLVVPRYICALFQNSSVRTMLSKIASGTSGSMKNISQQKLFAVSVPLAPYERQLDFENKAQMVRSIESEQTIAMQKAEATFDALLSRTFSTANS